MLPALFVFLIGLAVGSFLNVLVFRTREETAMGGRSRCPSCGTGLGPSELVPVVSYLALGGRCKHCGVAISKQYPIVEFSTGLLFLAFYLRYYLGWSLPEGLSAWMTVGYVLRDLVFTSFLILLFVYDFRYYLILDRFTVPAMIVAFAANAALGIDPLSLIAAGALIGGFFLFQYLISRGRWIGGGDIRMGVLMGLILGLRDGLAALFIAYAVGALMGIFFLTFKRLEWKSEIPFGTFLAFATILMLLSGDAIVEWYIALVGGSPDLLEFLRSDKTRLMRF